MNRSMTIRILVAATLISVPFAALAQTGPANDGSTGLFTLTGGDSLPAGEWSIGWYANNWDRFASESPRPGPLRHFETLVYDQTELSMSMAYGFTDRFELALAVPWVRVDEHRDETVGAINGLRYLEQVEESGLGALRLRAKLGLWDSEATSTRLSLTGGVDIPTTSENFDDPVQTGELDYTLGAAITSRYLTFAVGYLWRGDRGQFEIPAELRGGFGVNVPTTSNLDLVMEVDHVVFEDTGDSVILDATPRDQTAATLGVRYFVNDVVALNAALRTNLTLAFSGEDGNGHTALGWLAGVTYYPWTKGRRQTVIEGYGWTRKAPPPPPVITSPADGSTVTTATPQVAGTALPGATVHLSVDGAPVPDIMADAAGAWSTYTAPLAPGNHAAVATQTDPKTGLTSENSNVVHFRYEEPVVPKPPVVPEKKPETVMKDTVHFDSGSDKLTNIAKAILDQAALRIKADESATAVVTGYSDSQGSEESNLEISRRRAEACRTYLVERHGIDPARITIEAKGAADPVGDDATASGRKLNRRAVIAVTVLK